MIKCVICGQSNIDGAYDQFGSFVCVDCFYTGEARYEGRAAKVFSPVPGYDYSGIDFQATVEVWNEAMYQKYEKDMLEEYTKKLLEDYTEKCREVEK